MTEAIIHTGFTKLGNVGERIQMNRGYEQIIYLEGALKILFKDLSSSEIQIYRHLYNSNDRESTFNEMIVAKLDMSDSSLKRGLKKLIEKGAIVKLEHGRYKIPDKSNIDKILYLYIHKLRHIIKKYPDTNHISIGDIIDTSIDHNWEELQEQIRQAEEEREKREKQFEEMKKEMGYYMVEGITSDGRHYKYPTVDEEKYKKFCKTFKK